MIFWMNAAVIEFVNSSDSFHWTTLNDRWCFWETCKLTLVQPHPSSPQDSIFSWLFWAEIKAKTNSHSMLKSKASSKTHDYIKIKIKTPNPKKETPASSKAPNQDLKGIAVLCTIKIKIESKNLEHRYIKDQWPYSNQDQDPKSQSRTSSILHSPKSVLKEHEFSLHLQN